MKRHIYRVLANSDPRASALDAGPPTWPSVIPPNTTGTREAPFTGTPINIIVLNSLLSSRQEAVRSLRFEKGLENVLFLIYEPKNENPDSGRRASPADVDSAVS